MHISVKVRLIISIIFLLSIVGCEKKSLDKQKDSDLEELTSEAKEIELINQTSLKYNAVYFPSDQFNSNCFTYEIQDFFLNQPDSTFVFKGFLEDIIQTDEGKIVEFLCPLGEIDFVEQKYIRFRLSVADHFLERFSQNKEDDFMLQIMRLLDGPDYLIIATIKEINSSRIYRFEGFPDGEEVEIEMSKSKGLISNGHFIDFVKIPNN
jgi:hypothetical protein